MLTEEKGIKHAKLISYTHFLDMQRKESFKGNFADTFVRLNKNKLDDEYFAEIDRDMNNSANSNRLKNS